MSLSVACTICLENYEEKDGDFVVISCGHCYHRNCLNEWKTNSRKMECPECRQKYTARTMKKLFLHSVPKDDFPELQEEKQKYEKLKKESDGVRAEKRKLEVDLNECRYKYKALSERQSMLAKEFEIKCKEHDIASMVNDDYLRTNNKLKLDNKLLEQQIERLVKENANLKVHQLKAAKPFVDLTCDDDSDVEIIEPPKDRSENKIPKTPDIIQLGEANDDESDEFPGMLPPFSTKTTEMKYTPLEEFENFILEQIIY